MVTLGKIRDALSSGKQVFYYGDTGVDSIDEILDYSVSVIDASGTSLLCEASIKEDDLSEITFSISHEDFEFNCVDIY